MTHPGSWKDCCEADVLKTQSCTKSKHLLLTSKGELVAAGNRLDDNVLLLDTLGLELLDGAVDERLDDGVVPASVNNTDTERRAIVLRGRRGEALDSLVCHYDRFEYSRVADDTHRLHAGTADMTD